MALDVALVFGMALAVGETYTGEDEEASEDLCEGEGFGEEDRGHGGGEGALREKAYGGERGGKVAEGVGEEEIAAELGDEAKAENGPDSASVGHAQRDAHCEIHQQQGDSAGDHGQAEKCQRAGGAANFFRDHEVDGEAGGGGERFEIAHADARVVGEVRPEDDNRAGDGHQETKPESTSGTLAKDQPGEKPDENRSVVAEQCGVGGRGLENGGVV